MAFWSNSVPGGHCWSSPEMTPLNNLQDKYNDGSWMQTLSSHDWPNGNFEISVTVKKNVIKRRRVERIHRQASETSSNMVKTTNRKPAAKSLITTAGKKLTHSDGFEVGGTNFHRPTRHRIALRRENRDERNNRNPIHLEKQRQPWGEIVKWKPEIKDSEM